MNLKGNANTERLVIYVILIVLVLHQFKPHRFISEKITEFTKYETVIKKDSATVKKDSLHVDKIKVVYDTVTKIVRVPTYKYPKRTTEVKKQLNEVKDTTKLKNATVFSRILTDGDIYSYQLKAETKDSVVYKTKTIEKTIFHTPNKLFLNVEPQFTLNGFTGIETTLDYTINGKIRIGAGVGYNKDLKNSPIYFSGKIGIPIN